MSLISQGPISSPKGFNPLTHIPPKYDIYGFLNKNKHFQPKESILFTSNPNMKLPWNDSGKTETENTTKTQTKLFEDRRLAKIPDISYDLDKDGYVGTKDYFIAKQYDLDKDGKLNDREKEAAYEGISNNFEAKFKWNIDAQGIARPFRIMQKRGVIIDAEDFLPIQDTYPNHPRKQLIPHVATYTDLKTLRNKELKEAISDKIKKWEQSKANALIPNESIKELKRCPSHQSIKEIKSRMHKDARMKCGLTKIETDLKSNMNDPSLAYVYKPKHKTLNDIQEDLKMKDKDEAKKLTHTNRNYKDDISRLDEREEEIFSKLYNKEDTKTLNKIKEQRKKDILNYNMKVFSSQTIGIHGHELPKFSQSQSTIDFWKRNDEYKEMPRTSSHAELQENMKFWKKPEEFVLSDHKVYSHVTDPYQRTHEKKEVKDNLVIKLNRINVFKGFNPEHPKPINVNMEHYFHTYRWSSLVQQFASSKFRKGRFFDSISRDDSKHLKTKLDSMHNLSPDLGFFDKKNKDDKKKLESNLSPEIEPKMPKDILYQRFSLSASGSEGNIQIKAVPIKTKAF